MLTMTAALILLLAWSLFAFGAVYDWAFAPAALVAVTGGVWSLRSPLRRRAWLDLWLILLAGVAGLQLIPMPEGVRAILSPVQAGYFARISLAPPADGAWVPLSLYPGAWLFGAGALLAGIATFLWTRDTLESRGLRRVLRAIAWIALVVSAFALIQPALFPTGGIYGFWDPIASGTRPAGPIVGRPHFASWVILAWPLTVGYLFSHARSHWQNRRVSRSAAILGDARAWWLLLSAAMMIAAVLVTHSRSGVIGLGVAGVVLVLAAWNRTGASGRAGLVGFLAVVALAVSLWASPDAVLYRFEYAWSGVDGGRPQIWDQVWVLVRDFPIVGIGLGAFDVVMPAYQTSAFVALINHAHNQYLHLLAEGGLLLAVPAVGAVVTFLLTAWRRVRDDHTALVHARHGAFAGLCGLAVQSVFETPMLTPAVMFLAAVSAAVVVRGADPVKADDGEESEG